MATLSVRIVQLNPNAILPTYGTPSSAGADLYYAGDTPVTLAPHSTQMVHTGIAVAIPDGYVGLIYARSGLACKRDLAPANKVGVIDSDYRGEIIVALHNHGDSPREILAHERIAQLVIAPVLQADWQLVDALDSTSRGEGGFGSTGRQ